MMTIENSDMGDVTTNGVATSPTPAEKLAPKASKARPVRAVASTVENQASEEFGMPPRKEKSKSHKKKPHKVSASPKAKKKTHAKASASPKKAKASSPKAKHTKKKHASAHASSKQASAPKKTHAKHGHKKRPAHWVDGKAQLVVHSLEKLVRALDRGLPRYGKMLGIEKKATRGSVVRRLVELLTQGKLAVKK